MKLQYFGHQMGRIDSLEKTLMLGKTEGRRRMMKEFWGLEKKTTVSYALTESSNFGENRTEL